MGRPKGSKNSVKKKQLDIVDVQENIQTNSQDNTQDNIETKIDKTILNELPDIFPTSDSSTSDLTSKKNKQKSEDDKYEHCQRCHKIIRSQPNAVDTNTISGKADYHRNIPRKVKICNDCALELSKIIDDFLWDNGNGVQAKPYSSFGMQEMKNKETQNLEN